MMRYLACAVYVVTCDQIVEGAAPCVRLATKSDLRDPAIRLGCVSLGRTIPLSAWERGELARRYA